jgi:hypothetical protein
MQIDHVQVGEIEVPVNYFLLDEEDKKDLCMGFIETTLELLNRNMPVYISRVTILNKLLDSSIITNKENENYEICQILEDCRKIINEKTN